MSIKLILGLVVMMLSLNACGAPLVNMKVHVHEEDGKSIEGAYVEGSFYQDQVVSRLITDSHRGITDSDGVIKLSGHEDIYVDLKIKKNGYYSSQKRVIVRDGQGRDASVLLRSERKPIALYARHFKGFIPKNKIKIGFDFIKGDWVSPYGKGLNEDVYFYYDGYAESFFNYGGELNISFSNETDGLVELEYKNGEFSNLKLPYMAPEHGYVKTKTLVHKRKGRGASAVKENNFNKKKSFGYFLRTRSEEGSNGDVAQANYVKIGGEIIFDPRSEGNGAAYLEMTYYYNPTINDRNLEFNPRKNLFKNLKDEEKVSAP